MSDLSLGENCVFRDSRIATGVSNWQTDSPLSLFPDHFGFGRRPDRRRLRGARPPQEPRVQLVGRRAPGLRRRAPGLRFGRRRLRGGRLRAEALLPAAGREERPPGGTATATAPPRFQEAAAVAEAVTGECGNPDCTSWPVDRILVLSTWGWVRGYRRDKFL